MSLTAWAKIRLEYARRGRPTGNRIIVTQRMMATSPTSRASTERTTPASPRKSPMLVSVTLTPSALCLGSGSRATFRSSGLREQAECPIWDAGRSARRTSVPKTSPVTQSPGRRADGHPDFGRSGLVTPLSPEEDDELRRLRYLADSGTLSERCRARIRELRSRDRRSEIRPPREFANAAEPAQAVSPWRRLFSRR